MNININTGKQFSLDLDEELIVDLFAGGGGMSTAIELATGRSPHIACNHDADAISMHEANHPLAEHYQADVYEVCPYESTQGRPVGLLHASPDCTHHSQAAGGQPRNRKIRSLSWVVKRWAGQVRPKVITLENVRQITKWGPLVAKRCKETGRVLKKDGTVAAKGEQVPFSEQFLVPCPKREGRTWKAFVSALEELGYVVEWRVLVAADYGAPTTRERLFMVARCDGKPIVWPEPTHHKTPQPGQKPWRGAAECIDWQIKGKSVFGRQRPLAAATMKRIAKGIRRFVTESDTPFVVPTFECGTGSALDNPHGQIGAAYIVHAGHGEGKGKTQRRSSGSKSLRLPMGTVTASGGGGGHAVATAYMMQANGGFYTGAGRSLAEPASTITNTGSQQQLVSAFLKEAAVLPEASLKVARLLAEYEGLVFDELDDQAKAQLVSTQINGQTYYITDITLRLLEPKELFTAQGFPADYIISQGHDGRPLSKSAQVRMCGNSVSPPPAAALIQVNVN